MALLASNENSLSRKYVTEFSIFFKIAMTTYQIFIRYAVLLQKVKKRIGHVFNKILKVYCLTAIEQYLNKQIGRKERKKKRHNMLKDDPLLISNNIMPGPFIKYVSKRT